MQNKLQFKSHFHAETLSPDNVFLLSEQGHYHLTGSIYYELAPLLKEPTYSADELADLLSARFSFGEIFYALERLFEKNYIETASREIPRPEAAFGHLLNSAPEDVLAKRNQTALFIKGFGPIDTAHLDLAFQSIQIKRTEEAPKASLWVLVTHDYLDPDFLGHAEKAIALGIPCLLAKPIGKELWIGPLFEPKDQSCLECLIVNMKRNRFEESFLLNRKAQKKPLPVSLACLNSTLAMSFQWIATEVFKWMCNPETHPYKNKLFSFDFLKNQIQEHSLISSMECSVCSKKQRGAFQPLSLTSRPKQSSVEEGFRYRRPEEVLQKNRHLISPILGIVKALTPIPQPSGSSIHVYCSGHNFAISDQYTGPFLKDFRASSGGKGKTDIQAKTSAFCEAIERYCGIFKGSEVRIQASYQELGSTAIHPDELLHYSETQYSERDQRNKNCTKQEWIAHRFSEIQTVEWSPVWSLKEQAKKYIPTAFCYYGYYLNLPEPFCRGDSNGCAAGSCLEEAILHGFFELVERDCAAMWWYNRLERPGVDLRSFHEPYADALIADYEKMGREIWVLDLVNDLGIPTFVAVSRKTDGGPEELILSFGCHLDARIALVRALGELNQFLVQASSLKEEPVNRPTDVERSVKTSEWLKNAKAKEFPYLKPAPNENLKTLSDYPKYSSTDLLEDVLFCENVLENLRMEMLVLDQTHPEIELNVVKVIVPGLRHFWMRFAPGRLYDVPVKLGWLSEPLKEEQLNPIPIMV